MTIKVIAEIGINHKGSELRLKKIIDVASEARAWAIKFQFREISDFYAKKNEIGDEILSKEIEKSNLQFSKILKFTKYARSKKLKVGISFFRTKDLKNYINYINYFDFIKIPSAEFNNDDLINLSKKYTKNIFISSGGNHEKTIISKIKKLDKKKFIVMHCIANYPTLTGFQQLHFLKKLSRIKNLRFGYSSHDKDWEINLITMGMGISYIERHLTLNKSENGLDESSSSENYDFERICFFANNFKYILGSGERYPNQGEIINMQNLGTSFYAKKNLKKGEKLNFSEIELKAPRLGLSKNEIQFIKNKKLIANINKNEPVLLSSFKDTKYIFNEKKINFLIDKKISLPFRFHDAIAMHKNFPTKYNEWHLSYDEVKMYYKKKIKIEEFIDKRREYTLHLPDYINKNNLLDPFSNNIVIRKESFNVIYTTIKIAKQINELTKKKIKIVGSFSQINDNKKITLDRIFNLTDRLNNDQFEILPQWLPKIAWYFGGAQKIDIFNDHEDIRYLKKYNKKICLDISHLILSANYENNNWIRWYEELINYSNHLHLSDAKGIDGEGIDFGKGELKNFNFILNNKNVKVLEVWQGHLHNGFKFYNAINLLVKNYA